MELPPVTWVESVASTQSVLVARAHAGESAQVLATTAQTAGRGRRGREWSCPPGAGLAMSVLVRLSRHDSWTWLPLVTGVAVHEALTQLSVPGGLGLKWPNDVVVDSGPRRGKLAGIIAERVDEPAGTDPALVVGIGVNLAGRGLPPGATALDSLGVAAEPDGLASSLLGSLEAWLDRWVVEPSRVRAAYRQRCVTVGQAVRVRLPGGEDIEGTAAAIDEDGRLVLTTGRGAMSLTAGDVVHLRPR
jgi:BirA family biotin operon repressor/biotin-[acetyl-CoA-carboxylase] ligase